MTRPRLGVFGGTLVVFVSAVVFVRFLFPFLAQHTTPPPPPPPHHTKNVPVGVASELADPWNP